MKKNLTPRQKKIVFNLKQKIKELELNYKELCNSHVNLLEEKNQLIEQQKDIFNQRASALLEVEFFKKAYEQKSSELNYLIEKQNVRS